LAVDEAISNNEVGFDFNGQNVPLRHAISAATNAGLPHLARRSIENKGNNERRIDPVRSAKYRSTLNTIP
jgi:hypothetical protein